MITAVVPRKGDAPSECVDPLEQSVIDHPKYYNQGKIEVIDYIDDKMFNFNLGNVVKYISRAGHKKDAIEDLEKALWYLKHEIDRRKKEAMTQ